jgi:DNA-binding GntR family transcriptional regulator
MIAPPQRACSLADRAYNLLEEMIVTLALPPGSVVTEGELAKRIGIGRTPLREALLRLGAQHLVTTRARRGLVINEISLNELLGILETRRVLDRLVGVGAAKRALPPQREALKALAPRMDEAGHAGDLTAFLRLDLEADELIGAACRNPAAARATTALHVHSRRFWYLHQHEGDIVHAAALHARMLRAIADGDERRTIEATDALMDYLESFTRAGIDSYLTRSNS